jgi:hypothetical protein
MYVTISVGYGRSVPKLLSRWVQGAAPGKKEKTFEFSECRRYVHKIIEHIFIHTPYNPFLVPEFINFHILALV